MTGFGDAMTASDIVDLYGGRGNVVEHAQSQVQEIIHSNSTTGISTHHLDQLKTVGGV